MKQSTGSGGSFALGRSEPRGEGDLGALRAGSNAKPYDPEAPRHLDTGKRHAMLDGPTLPTMVKFALPTVIRFNELLIRNW